MSSDSFCAMYIIHILDRTPKTSVLVCEAMSEAELGAHLDWPIWHPGASGRVGNGVFRIEPWREADKLTLRRQLCRHSDDKPEGGNNE